MITLTTPKTVIITPQVTKTISTLTIQRVVDNPVQKIVRAFVSEIPQPITLWDSTTTPSYDAIGQWTDSQVIAALTALYA